MFTLILIYLLLGILAGTLAGFFGIGGGVILVPALMMSLKLTNVSPEIFMHLTLGTSLACIFITALNSVWSHHQNKNIDWLIFKKLLLGVLIGTFLGAQLASQLPSHILKIVFALFITFIFLKMCFQVKHKPQSHKVHNAIYWLVGGFIGFKSSILGIGGGTISIPFLTWTGKTIKKAIGISASIGLPISLIGSLTYICNGYAHPKLPEYSFGFIYLPAFLGIVSTSAIFARVGAKLSHNIHPEKLHKAFLFFLFIILLKTYYGVWSQISS